uniref:GLI family zinc finger 2 n=1 Tax=Pipistrellus kuhlii TaxID=59472 RepID=A0A7J7XV81_PIPKU|nr:GLI family zinc finger 2 [Pipistrellus kuhlii]
MDTSAPASAAEKKEGKSAIPEGAARKTSALAVAATAAAAAAAQGACHLPP